MVYDYVEGPLIPMARPDNDQGPDAGIPSVFVTASGGRVLRAALSGPLGGALITLRAPQTFGDWPSLLAGAFVACLVASAALSATCGGGGPGGNDGDDAEAAEARRRRRDRERLLTATQIVAATETCVFSSADASIGATAIRPAMGPRTAMDPRRRTCAREQRDADDARCAGGTGRRPAARGRASTRSTRRASTRGCERSARAAPSARPT